MIAVLVVEVVATILIVFIVGLLSGLLLAG